jgi:hypothetical protein
MLEYIRDHYGAPKNIIYAISRQTYFSSENASKSLNADQIINELYQNISYQLIDDPVNVAGRLDWVKAASDWELPGGVTSYEGGLSTPSDGVTSNLGNQIKMHRSERMINLIRYNFANSWFDIGGGLAMYFTLVSGYNRYGAWGLTDDLRDPDRNYKMEAVRHLQTITALNDPAVESSLVSVYPNPTKGKITINSGRKGPVNIEILDIHGRMIFKSTHVIPGDRIDLGMANEGLYIIRMQDRDWEGTGKIMIQR